MLCQIEDLCKIFSLILGLPYGMVRVGFEISKMCANNVISLRLSICSVVEKI